MDTQSGAESALRPFKNKQQQQQQKENKHFTGYERSCYN